jgi:hypothetical protein
VDHELVHAQLRHRTRHAWANAAKLSLAQALQEAFGAERAQLAPPVGHQASNARIHETIAGAVADEAASLESHDAAGSAHPEVLVAILEQRRHGIIDQALRRPVLPKSLGTDGEKAVPLRADPEDAIARPQESADLVVPAVGRPIAADLARKRG